MALPLASNCPAAQFAASELSSCGRLCTVPIAKGAGRSSPGPRELVGLKALVASSCQAGKGDQGHRGFAAWPCLGQPGRSLWAAGDASPHFLCFSAPPSSHTAPAQLLPQPLLASRLIMATCTKAIITETSTVPSTPMRQTPISEVNKAGQLDGLSMAAENQK